jgi:hypothetical protein
VAGLARFCANPHLWPGYQRCVRAGAGRMVVSGVRVVEATGVDCPASMPGQIHEGYCHALAALA